MATMDIGIPRFYPDLINFLMTTGTAQNGNFDVMSGSDLISTYVKGSEAELFDLRPINTVTFNTTASASVQADHVLVRINKQTASWQTDYIAILNHNMSTAKAKIRVNSSDTASDVQVADMGGNAITNVTEIVNADTISNNVIIPDDDVQLYLLLMQLMIYIMEYNLKVQITKVQQLQTMEILMVLKI